MNEQLEVRISGRDFGISLKGYNEQASKEIRELFTGRDTDLLTLLRAYLDVVHKKCELESSVTDLDSRLADIACKYPLLNDCFCVSGITLNALDTQQEAQETQKAMDTSHTQQASMMRDAMPYEGIEPHAQDALPNRPSRLESIIDAMKKQRAQEAMQEHDASSLQQDASDDDDDPIALDAALLEAIPDTPESPSSLQESPSHPLATATIQAPLQHISTTLSTALALPIAPPYIALRTNPIIA